MDIEKEYSCLERNHQVYRRCVDNDEDYQESLPQYCDDIYRVIKCVSNSFITSVDVNYNEIKIIGKTEICLTYLNEASNLCYADFEEEFTKNINIEGLSDSAFPVTDINNKYTNFRVINQRRIDIHTSSAINIRVFDNSKCPCIKSCDGSKLRVETVETANVICSNICRAEFDDEMTISADSKPIKRIISSSSYVTLNETKIIKDKVLIKATVSVEVLYTTDDQSESIMKCQSSFAVSKIIDVPGLSEKDCAVAQLSIGNIFFKAKSSGDKLSVIEVYGDVSISAVFIRNQEIKMITDGYILNRKSSCSFSDFNLCKNGRYISDSKMQNVQLDFSNDITEIKQLSLDVSNPVVRGGKLTSKISAVAICVNNSGELCSFASSNDFEIDAEPCDEALAAISVQSYDYTLEQGGKLNVRLSVGIYAYTYMNATARVLSEIDADDEIISYPALTVYFGKKSESVWNIAKSFSSDIDLISRENDLSADVLESNKILIIPGI